MIMSIRLFLGAVAVAAVISPANAQAPVAWPQVGTLNCRLSPSIGFVIAGHQSMECRFPPNTPEPPQRYDGAINTAGLDVGFTTGGAFSWAVFASTVGAQGRSPANMSASPATSESGFGGGANVLIGGSGRSFALQPVSLEGSVGLDVALGVSALKLRPVR
jgi:Protein of unknown function (DUF992)